MDLRHLNFGIYPWYMLQCSFLAAPNEDEDNRNIRNESHGREFWGPIHKKILR